MVQSPCLTRIRLDFGSFAAYDVEPANIPDIFSERPVIVYGKWRGQPQGKITLRGQSGTKLYQTSIDVATVTPQLSNSALRYLWARTRLAQLSDYSQLHQGQATVAEITRLALRYGLLSAHTSFVAIDTYARRSDGELATVQQVLPLPEGVSDLAVGKAGGALTIKSLAAAALSAPPLPERASQFETERRKAETKDQDTSRGDQNAAAGREQEVLPVRVGEIRVAGELTEPAVRDMVAKHLAEIESCFASVAAQLFREKFTVQWVIDPLGKVSQVRILFGQGTADASERCLVEEIERWHFPRLSGKGPVTVTASFLLGHQDTE
jgi:Ca-activated chloride channel family protein